MSQSRDYTLKTFYREAAQDLQGAGKIPRHIQKDLVNRAVATIAERFYDLWSNDYMTDAIINYETGGIYDDGASTYTSTGHLVTLTTPSTNLANSDVEKLVVFRIGTTIYSGKVLSVSTTKIFVFDGDIFPSTDGNIATGSLAICASTVQNNVISLSSIRIMRNAKTKIELSTNATGATIRAGSQRQVDTFDTGGRNAKTVIWCLSGDNINFAVGTGLTNAGTITIHYPRVPYLVSAATDKIDIPDGIGIELAILYLRGLIQLRLGQTPENSEVLIQRYSGDVYKSMGREIPMEADTSKPQALK
jgi:hypothetical protein